MSPARGGRSARREALGSWIGPPVIIVDGAAGTAISVARSLGRSGVTVYLLSEPDCPAVPSRYTCHIPTPGVGSPAERWASFLLGPASSSLAGAVLLFGSDAALEMMLDHRDELAARYVLDICAPGPQRCFLDKLSTYRAARAAGVPTPRFWEARTDDDLRALRDELVYPLILKPLLSHEFSAVFHVKFFRVTGFEELLERHREVRDAGQEVMLVEEIDGPDDLLCSYYTYVDERGAPLFDFTKRIIRRYPEHEGLACYHVTDWNPEVRDVALRLVRHAGLLGLANVEFKRDPRDGVLKLIECNARFTAANGLVAASGYDLAGFVYRRLTEGETPPLAGAPYVRGLHLWNPGKDFRAFLELRTQGRLTAPTWVKSVLHRQVLYYFRWDDPLPAAVLTARAGRRAAAKAGRRVVACLAERSAAAWRDGGTIEGEGT